MPENTIRIQYGQLRQIIQLIRTEFKLDTS